MAEKIVSPGVFTNEIDQSFIPAALGELGAAIIGPTVKGPVLVPTVVSSYSEFTTIFGELIESGSDKYQYLTSHTAKEYLRQGGPCTIVRVADADVSRASATIASSGTTEGANRATGSITFTAAASGSDSGVSDEVQIYNTHYTFVSSSAQLENTSTQIFVSFAHATLSGSLGSARNLVEAINDGERDGTTAMGITASFLDTAPAVEGGSGGQVQLSGSSLGTSANLTVTIDGNNEDSPFATATNIGGGTTTGTAGSDLFTLQVLGDGPSFNNSSSIGTDHLLAPLTSSRGNQQYSSGSFGGRSNNFRWEISNRNLEKGTFTLLLRAGNDTIKRKQVLETHANLSLDPESSNYILKRVGNQIEEIAVEEGLAYLQPSGDFGNRSKLVRVSSLPDSSKTDNYLDDNGVVNAKYADSASFFPAAGSGSYGGTFSGGDYGQEYIHPFAFYDNISETNSQGVKMADSSTAMGTSTVGGGYRAAISLLSNKDQYNFNLLFLPGVLDGMANHSTIITAAIDLCESRTDCFFVMDPSGKTDGVADVKANVKSRNSSYAATYYPWVQIQDASLGAARWVPPSVVMAGVYHFNDAIGQPWFAPAGLNRGGVDSAIQAYKKLTQSQRDELYDRNINPIATFPGQGVTVFGQKTLQKAASALDRVNVRRLLINVKSFIARSSRNLLFEQNTSDLRDQFLNTVNPFLEQVQSNQGLNAFRVVMDETNNTPETIDRNQLIGQVFLQPARTAEFIVLDFIVQPTGAAFPE